MIKCHLAKLMGERKLKVIDVANATGLNRSTVTAMYKESVKKVDLEALDKLCEYFECQVSDLLERADE